MGPTIIAVALVLALLVMLPTRRLALGGASRQTLVAYFLAVWLLGIVAATGSGPMRLLVPILLVAYLIPFVTFRAGLVRLRRGFGRPASPETWPESDRPEAGQPLKDVTPRDSTGNGA